jgi:hypothetical protein
MIAPAFLERPMMPWPKPASNSAVPADQPSAKPQQAA